MRDDVKLTINISLREAKLEDLVVNWAIYDKNLPINGIEMKLHVMKQLKDAGFWILLNDEKIGGVFISPNQLSRFFVIPPYEDSYLLLKLLNKYLFSISDKNQPFLITSFEPEYEAIYLSMGYTILDKRRWMIRPTEEFEIQWDDKYHVRKPDKKDLNSLIDLFVSAYGDSIDEKVFNFLNPKGSSQDSFRNQFGAFFEKNDQYKGHINSSLVVINKESKELVAACLITIWESIPLVYELGVRKVYRGKGIAKNLLKHVLTELKKEYKFLILFVTLGNPSESLYYNLGFRRGPTRTLFYFENKDS